MIIGATVGANDGANDGVCDGAIVGNVVGGNVGKESVLFDDHAPKTTITTRRNIISTIDLWL